MSIPVIFRQIQELKETLIKHETNPKNDGVFIAIQDVKLRLDILLTRLDNVPKYRRLIVLRHSKRADCSLDKDELLKVGDNIGDPPLSSDGFDIITSVTNEYLKNFPIIAVETSIFTRCTQTTCAIIDILKTYGNNITTVKANYNIGEVRHPKVTKMPLEDIYLRSDNNPSGIVNFDDIPSGPLYKVTDQETRGIGGSADQRYCNELVKIAKSYKPNNEAILIVTHGDCVGSFVHMMDPTKSVYEVDFCGFVVGDYYEEENKWVFRKDLCKGVGIMND